MATSAPAPATRPWKQAALWLACLAPFFYLSYGFANHLASLRTDAPLPEDLEDLRWRGGRRDALMALCQELGEDELVGMVPRWRNGD